jgi:hypothetical protein
MKLEIKTYKYSAARMLMGFAWLFFLEIYAYITFITRNADSQSWLVFYLFSAIILSRLIYLCVMYYIPCLREKTALELDDEKLQSFITGKLLFQIPPGTIYWKDIDDIEYDTTPGWMSFSMYKVSIISFTMKDGSVAGISTKSISGKDKEIYESVMEYFKKGR